jgi:hypothetical protein
VSSSPISSRTPGTAARVWTVRRRVLPWRPGWGGFGDPFTIPPPSQDDVIRPTIAQKLGVDPILSRRSSAGGPKILQLGRWDSVLVFPWAAAVLAIAALSLLWTVVETVVLVVIVTPLSLVARALLHRPWTIEGVSNVPGYEARYAEHWVWRVPGSRASGEMLEAVRAAAERGQSFPPSAARRFPFRGTAMHRFCVDVEPERVRVRTHLWGDVPLSAVGAVEELTHRTVRIHLDPPCRMRLLGLPVRRRVLTLRFLRDPEGLRSALEPGR